MGPERTTSSSDANLSEVTPDSGVAARKAELRRVMRERRRATALTSDADTAEAATKRGERLAWWSVVRGAGLVAAYASYGDEPRTAELIDALRSEGLRVLLPVTLDDGDLDWAPFRGADSMVVGPRGVRVPTGPTLGVHALEGVECIFVPALAVDRDGHRLGQGGGSYDRALTRIRDDVPIVALLHDGELLDSGEVPSDHHDVRVTHVVMPSTGIVAVGQEASA